MPKLKSVWDKCFQQIRDYYLVSDVRFSHTDGIDEHLWNALQFKMWYLKKSHLGRGLMIPVNEQVKEDMSKVKRKYIHG